MYEMLDAHFFSIIIVVGSIFFHFLSLLNYLKFQRSKGKETA